MYKKYIKRLIDFVLSLLGLIVLFVPLVIVGLITVIDTKGPVFFKQKRIGLNKKEFMIYKFRSMPTVINPNLATADFDGESMLTKWEKFIRKSSVDELPQLLNIIKGEMSIIGPRPALWNQYDLIKYRDEVDAHSVRPGLTGWAQINGRDAIDDKEKAAYDGQYVKNLSFGFDVKCFFLTIVKVLKHEDVIEGGKKEA